MSFIKAFTPKTVQEYLGIYQGKWFPEMDRCWEDYERGYSVCSRMIYTKQFGNVEHVTITKQHKKGEPLVSTDGANPIGWSEKMMIKNELFGEDRFAIEVYPKQKYLVDSADVYHLWVFSDKYDMPFGIHPKEYKKAINRGDAKLKPEEIMLLAEKINGNQMSVEDKDILYGLLENEDIL